MIELSVVYDVVWITDGVDCAYSATIRTMHPPAVKENKKTLNEYFDVNITLVSNHSPTSATTTATVMALVVQWWWWYSGVGGGGGGGDSGDSGVGGGGDDEWSMVVIKLHVTNSLSKMVVIVGMVHAW